MIMMLIYHSKMRDKEKFTEICNIVTSTLQLPENVKYCLENKVPYHWYELLEYGEDPIQVRLNCQQIGDNEIAIEVSDGVWGTT